jgi:hypothetical protein
MSFQTHALVLPSCSLLYVCGDNIFYMTFGLIIFYLNLIYKEKKLTPAFRLGGLMHKIKRL